MFFSISIFQSVFVMPSSSARCAQLPRAVDKVPFYIALKKLRDHLCGALPDLDFSEVSFPDVKLKVEVKEDAHDDCFTDYSKNDVSATVHRSLQTPESELRMMIPVTRGKRGRKRKADLARYPPAIPTETSSPRPRGRGSGRRGRGRRPVEHSGYNTSNSSWSGPATVSSPYFSNDSTPQNTWQHWQESQNGSETSFQDHSQTHNLSPAHNYQIPHTDHAAKQQPNNQYYGGYDRPYMGYSQADCSYVPQVDTYAKVKDECYESTYSEY